MQYFTFLGTGGTDGYSNLVTFFDGDEESVYETSLIQKAVYERHKNEIDEILIFMTKKAEELNYDKISQARPDVKLTKILIEDNINSQAFVQSLLEHLRENDKAIFDVTHGFRSIPMKLLFVLKYLETSKNTAIEHLYYSQVINDTEEVNKRHAIVMDVIKDYNLQQLAEMLSQFEQTLILKSEEWKPFVGQEDEKAKRFFTSLSEFTKMIELCEFDRSLNSISKISKSALEIKEDQKYYLLHPLASRIQIKFDVVEKADSDLMKKIKIIEVLLDHNRLQNAITFTDELYREQLIFAALSDSRRMSDEERMTELYDAFIEVKRNRFTYLCSQYIIQKYFKKHHNLGTQYYEFEFNDIWNEDRIKKMARVYADNSATISTFVDEIRNNINHGTSTNKGTKPIRKKIEKMLKVIIEISKVYTES